VYEVRQPPDKHNCTPNFDVVRGSKNQPFNQDEHEQEIGKVEKHWGLCRSWVGREDIGVGGHKTRRKLFRVDNRTDSGKQRKKWFEIEKEERMNGRSRMILHFVLED